MIEADMALRRAVIAGLNDDGELSASLNGVFDGLAVRATTPFAEVGEALVGDYGTKGLRGREVRIAITLRDANETSTRIAGLAGRAARVIEDLPREMEGWRLASLALTRIRTAGDGPGRWLTALDYRARLFETEEM